jgi:hypothetical protein
VHYRLTQQGQGLVSEGLGLSARIGSRHSLVVGKIDIHKICILYINKTAAARDAYTEETPALFTSREKRPALRQPAQEPATSTPSEAGSPSISFHGGRTFTRTARMTIGRASRTIA